MKKYLLLLMGIFYFMVNTHAHNNVKGKVVDFVTKNPLSSVYINILNARNRIIYSDAEGNFEFKSMSSGMYYIQLALMGYRTKTDTFLLKENEDCFLIINLEEDIIEMPAVMITARKEFSQTIINSLDFKLRPHNTTQDLLRLVPGLFIAQHAGGGKAEQIFLRGFDVDHGTDVAISVDGMPVNMVSHAHGQGYADLHFVIPETVDNMSFSKGPYDAKTGDFNTAGAVRFHTKNFVRKNMIKYETGRFGVQRALVMLNLIPHKDSTEQRHKTYIASEYFYARGYFQKPQDFHRFNIFGKYDGQFSDHTHLQLSFSTFTSKWNASGQIPQRAVDNGSISRFGSIDPTEGGNTTRTNVNAMLTNYTHNSGVIKNQFYFTDYGFDLYSNFTFFKDDSLNGDQINQYEHRHMFGYNGSYNNDLLLGKTIVKGTIGIGARIDRVNDIGLAHTIQRQFLNDIKKGKIEEYNFNGYADASFLFSENLTLNTGLRYDYFIFHYENRLNDTILPIRAKGIVSPKFNLYYKVTPQVQLYLSGGYGFHSNDARVAVVRTDISTLPLAKSIDLGTNFRLAKKIFINTALWYMFLQSEYVYLGDDGLLELSGRTQRVGIDLSARYQFLKWMFVDVDVNYAHPRFIDLPEGENFVPLAPPFTSVGGIGINGKDGFSGSLKYRYLGERPAMEDNAVVASGYFLLDAVVTYQWKSIKVNLTAENLLNQKWKEAQFATESKLKGEPVPITEIHFTPGTPFFIKAGLAFIF